MLPTLGQTVLYVPLANEPAQSFVAAAATGQPVGEAVVRSVTYPHGYRAATVVGFVGQPAERRVALLVYKQPGDPSRGNDDTFMQRLGDVPYSAHGVPGTWMHAADSAEAKPTAVPKTK